MSNDHERGAWSQLHISDMHANQRSPRIIIVALKQIFVDNREHP